MNMSTITPLNKAVFIFSLPPEEFMRYYRKESFPQLLIDDLLIEARKHKVLSLVYNNAVAVNLVDNDHVLEGHKHFIEWDKIYYKKLTLINRLLKDWSDKYIFIKGINISHYCYNMQLGVRTAGDFDILTDPLTAEEIFSHLQNIGLQKDYQTCNRDDYNKTYMHHLTPLYSNNGRVYIEIHHRLNLSFDSYIPNTTDMITRKRIIDINGESIPINSLEDCMYVVCYNMYMDQHYIHSYSLKPYASIIALTKKVDFNKLLSIVTTDKCIFPVSYALYCADYLYKFMTGNYLLTDKIKKDFCFDEFHDQFNYIRHHMAFSNDILGKWGSEFPLEDRVFMQALSLNPKAQAFFDHKIAQYFFRQHWVTAVNKLPDGYFDIYSHWEYVDPII